jgi:hypothetical protein
VCSRRLGNALGAPGPGLGCVDLNRPGNFSQRDDLDRKDWFRLPRLQHFEKAVMFASMCHIFHTRTPPSSLDVEMRPVGRVISIIGRKVGYECAVFGIGGAPTLEESLVGLGREEREGVAQSRKRQAESTE